MSALKRPLPWPLDRTGKPKRRVAVPGSRGVYWRVDGMLEVGYRDADGRQRWRGPFETLTSAREARDDARARARGGERESANPRLKFGEAADRGWQSKSSSCGRRRKRSTATRSATILRRAGVSGGWMRSTSPMPRAWCVSCVRRA
jgi:hypothetical protein